MKTISGQSAAAMIDYWAAARPFKINWSEGGAEGARYRSLENYHVLKGLLDEFL